MREKKVIPTNYTERINEIMSISWKIFISQFINNRHVINKEAPFQHHFAQIIRTVENAYKGIDRKEIFSKNPKEKV